MFKTMQLKRWLCVFFLASAHSLIAAVVTSVSPTNGPLAGGNVVTILGSGFTGASTVNFGFRPAAAFVVINDTTISATVPVGTVGTFDVTVDGSSITRNDLYTYTTVGWEGILSGTPTMDIAFFSTATNTFTSSIADPASSVTSVIRPDGTWIYAANSIPPGISVIDAATKTITSTIPTGVGPGAFDMVINPAGTRLYVSNTTSGFVTVIDATTNTVITDIFVQTDLGPVSVSPDGSLVFVKSFSTSDMYVIDTATNTVSATIPTGFYASKVSITPDGTKAFIPAYFGDAVLVMDLPSLTITNTIPLPFASGPYGSSILPNGETLYIVNNVGNSISVIDIASEILIATIPTTPPLPVNSFPFWAASTPDSKTVYIINSENDLVLPLDVATNTIGAPFGTMGGQFFDLIISPDPSPVAVFTAIPQPVGAPTTFDASGSLSPIGTIVSYAWDFGDDVTLTTGSPITNHVYAVPGNYPVTLTVTNSAGTSTKQVFSSGFMSNNGGPLATVNNLVVALPSPPIDPSGFQKRCKSLTQTEYVNVLRWNAPQNWMPASYRIYRDLALTQLAGTVPGNGPLEFFDCHRKKYTVYTYYIVSVSFTGVESPPVVVVVNPL